MFYVGFKVYSIHIIQFCGLPYQISRPSDMIHGMGSQNQQYMDDLT
jgi:hypothetical protein